ncbi:MAG TPA: hypothetical protein VFI41_04680 [Gemmatimonadales bacterium]|nr:hypothetical protein [Gemmatimonadales bacterium]
MSRDGWRILAIILAVTTVMFGSAFALALAKPDRSCARWAYNSYSRTQYCAAWE